MPKFLSQEWLDLQRSLVAALPGRPGVSARLQHVVIGAPDGDVAYAQEIADGRIVKNELGRDDSVDAALTLSHADAVAILTGNLDANAAFMQGRVKVVGSMGALMAIMPLTQSPEYTAMLGDLAAQTEL